MKQVVPTEIIERRIFLIREQKVMLSAHLAEFYGVAPRVLVQAVKRNVERFPEDFMFQLTQAEFQNLKSQFVTSSWGGIRRATPYAFTQEGVAMLSGVLHSKQAIRANVAIMRAFVRLRNFLAAHKHLAERLAILEKEVSQNKTDIHTVFKAIRDMMEPPPKPKRKIGFFPQKVQQ
ncbi:MAG: ORF6N domain-containing protein [Elusimicrobia bacterium]|nr:ORF6N domain-containing protein [Elusimicrobiota bacterium]